MANLDLMRELSVVTDSKIVMLVADVVAVDSVVREGVQAFLERHPDYRLAPELSRYAPKA